MRRSIKYGLYAAVLASVLGSTIAWASVDKSVTIDVDGQSTQLHTVASTVKGALADAGYRVGPHDIVAPALDASVHSGSTIVLERGRMLRLTVDGIERNVWVTSPTVADALADLGYETVDLDGVSRSTRLPLSPTDLTLSTLKSVTVTEGSQVTPLTTTDNYVAEVLNDLGIGLGADDTVTPPPNAILVDGENIVVNIVTKGTVTAQAPIPFATTSSPDSSLDKGVTRVTTSGHNGLANVVYAVVYVNGVESGRTIVSSQTITAPVTQVQQVGTKPAAAAVTIVVDPGSAEAIAQQMVLARGWDSSQFECLLELWGHESGWRVNAQNSSSGAYGIPQALPGSKMAVDGPDWQSDATTQITWGLGYIAGRYGTPCGAWSFWQANDWY